MPGEPSPPSVNTLREWAESDEVKRKVYDQLQKNDMLRQDMGFAGFQKALVAEIKGGADGRASGTTGPIVRLDDIHAALFP